MTVNDNLGFLEGNIAPTIVLMTNESVERIDKIPEPLSFVIKQLDKIQYLQNETASAKNKIETYLYHLLSKINIKFSQKNFISRKDILHIRLIYWEKYLSRQKIIDLTGITKEQIDTIIGLKIQTLCIKCNATFIKYIGSNRSLDMISNEQLCNHCKKEQKINNKFLRNEREKQQQTQEQKQYQERNEEIQQLKTMSYAEYLKTDHWDMVRKLAYRKAKYKCSICNEGDLQLNAHHKTYEHRGEEQYYLQDIIVLCVNCHSKFHDKLVQA